MRRLRSQLRWAQVFYLKGNAYEMEEGLKGSIVHPNGLEGISGLTQDALANIGNLSLGGSP